MELVEWDEVPFEETHQKDQEHAILELRLQVGDLEIDLVQVLVAERD